MNVRNDDATEFVELRRRAEGRMRTRAASLPDLSDIEIKQLVFELGTHQIELEMQNEELRRAQHQAAESRDLFTELYDFAPVGYLTIDQNGCVVQANLTVAELFHIEREKLIGKYLLRLVHPDDADDLFLNMRRLDSANSQGSIEGRLKRAAGDDFHARLSIGAPRSVGQNDARRLVAISDITEVKQAEADRNELQQQLQQSQRLESLGVLAGGIAHDFNNLLTSIKLNNGVVDDSLEQDSHLRNNTEQIEFAVQQSSALCEQMLVYAGKGVFEKSAFDVSNVLQGTSKLLRASVAKTISLEMRLAEDLPMVIGDPTQIRQVALNLVMNASEAINKGGCVAVTTRMSNSRDPLLVNTTMSGQLLSGDYVCIEVSDTGCGLSDADIPKIFEPFFTTKFAGRGLGMSVVAGVVRRHDGVISVTSKQQVGTTIRVLLPVADMTALDESISSNGVERPTKYPETEDVATQGFVLVVDDEPLVRKAVQASLEATNFSVFSAGSGEQALEVFRENADSISLVLLDLTMPGLSSDATISGLRKIRDDVPIVLMSGHSESDISSFLVENNIAAFLPKPMGSPAELIQQVLRS